MNEGPLTGEESVHEILHPLAEELRCAVAARGDCVRVFPGMEAHANLAHVRERLDPLLQLTLPHRVRASLEAVAGRIEATLEAVAADHAVLGALVADFTRLRKVLGHREWPGKRVRREVDKWVKMIRSRLKRRGLPHDPRALKRQRCEVGASPEEVWQEWVRLVHSHAAGLYHAYDDPGVEFTNNPKEWIFRDGRHHYRGLLGRGNVHKVFIVHEKNYCRVKQLDLSSDVVEDILLGADRDLVEAGLRELRDLNRETRRTWRIRDVDTGNFEKLERNLRACCG